MINFHDLDLDEMLSWESKKIFNKFLYFLKVKIFKTYLKLESENFLFLDLK